MIGSKIILGWERLPIYSPSGYVEIIKCFLTNLYLYCRLSIGVLVLSIYGHLYRRWSIKTCLWRFVHGWRLWWGIIFTYIGESMTTELDLLSLQHRYRRFYSVPCDLYFCLFLVSLDKTYSLHTKLPCILDLVKVKLC
jgi:hypothetical protein